MCVNPLSADSFTLDLGTTGGSMMGRLIQLLIMMTVLTLAPSIVMMVTSFTRIVVVFSFVRSALGTQQSPPNMILLSLAMFLSFFIMAPTFEKAFDEGIHPLIEEKISEKEAFDRTTKPFQQFMLKNVREKDLILFADIAKIDSIKTPEDTPLRVLVPAFIISELKRAFEIGFLIFIPFLVIDMVVASVLMSMGMMMLPPVMISLPFKLIFFVLVDGWHLLCGSLVNSFR
jgi:flagellar biosynthetic protein FliP